MNSTVNELIDKAMDLSPDDRALLAHRIWDSLEDFIDPEIEKAWMKEAQRRWQEIKSCKVETISANEVFKNIEEKLNKKNKK